MCILEFLVQLTLPSFALFSSVPYLSPYTVFNELTHTSVFSSRLSSPSLLFSDNIFEFVRCAV